MSNPFHFHRHSFLLTLNIVLLIITTCTSSSQTQRETDQNAQNVEQIPLSAEEMTRLRQDYVKWFARQPPPVTPQQTAHFMSQWRRFHRFSQWRENMVNDDRLSHDEREVHRAKLFSQLGLMNKERTKHQKARARATFAFIRY